MGCRYQEVHLRGYYTHNLILTCFVCYVKIIKIILKKNVCILKNKLSKELKNGSEILVGQAMDQNSQNIVLIYNSRTSWVT